MASSLKDLKFSLIPARYRNIYKPAAQEINHSFGGGSTDDLLLYKLGDDEFAHAITAGQTYKGLLVVRTNISAVFVDGASNWTAAQKRQWFQRLDRDFRQMLDAKYRLECSDPKNDFANIYIRFMPHGEVVTGASSAAHHFRVVVTKDNSSGFSTSGKTVNVGNNCDNRKIIRYFFGKDATLAGLTSADLGVIKTWVQGPAVANGTFTFHNI